MCIGSSCRERNNNAKRREKLYARGGNLSTMKGGLSYIFFSFFPPIFDITIAGLIYAPSRFLIPRNES